MIDLRQLPPGLTLQQQLLASAIAREFAEGQRLRDAHLRKYAYTLTGPALTRKSKTAPALFANGTPVPTFRQHKRETKKYGGSLLRELRATRGCGHKTVTRAYHTLLVLPWRATTAEQNVVAFNVRDKGMHDVAIFRKAGSRLKRCRLLESEMSVEQWDSVVRATARIMQLQLKFAA